MKYKIIGGIIAAILLVGIAGSVFALTAQPKNTVRIVSQGKTLYTVDLSTADNTTFDIKYGDHTNTVEIKDHRIRVKDADCPDKTCVKTGWLKSSSMPIVCLPHHLVIEFTDNTDELDEMTR